RDEYFLKQKDAAVPALEKAIALGDKSKEMYNVLGRTYVDSRDWQKALDAYTKGDPNATDQMKIGQVEVFLGNNDAADSVYRALIAHDSTSSEAKFALGELGKLRFRLKDYPGTIAVLKRRIALDPNDDEAYYYTGLSYKEMKQIPEAVAALRQAATLAPAKGDRQFWLGVVLSQADSSDAADEAFQRSVAADSTSRNAAIALQQLGYHQLLHKNWVGAIGMLERSVVIDDKSVQTLIWLAQAYQNSGNRVKAVEYYHKVLQLQPGQPDAAKGLKTLGA
ncbi:MAG TPA: tetratricopeptide repeat protein, partial [Candidatus Eisenbacteria bacterium]|nr:tetratricopeptide repeat protein [Candidatus Eisenbacteria bacterium]